MLYVVAAAQLPQEIKGQQYSSTITGYIRIFTVVTAVQQHFWY